MFSAVFVEVHFITCIRISVLTLHEHTPPQEKFLESKKGPMNRLDAVHLPRVPVDALGPREAVLARQGRRRRRADGRLPGRRHRGEGLTEEAPLRRSRRARRAAPA